MSSAFESLPAPEAKEVAAGLRQALALLVQAYDYAQELRCPVWDFAVEIAGLHAAGVTNNDLRWLAHHGYVENATERTGKHARQRTFGPVGVQVFEARTCFVLTPAGMAFARRLGTTAGRLAPPSAQEAACTALGAAAPATPVWDAERRELRLGGVLVKKFRRPAANQELILAVFQEEGWPARIDDPLPNGDKSDPVERLHFTIRHLNQNQQTPLLRFRGDGSGAAVTWEVVLKFGGS
jgi:hypothetical protein